MDSASRRLAHQLITWCTDQLLSFTALTLLVGSYDMTYNVFGGTLNPTQPINPSIIFAWKVQITLVYVVIRIKLPLITVGLMCL